MFCTQCRTELPSGAKFCPECGSPVGQANQGRTLKSVRFECKGCHAVMTLKEGSNILKCPFCDSTELIVESNSVAMQRIKSNAYRDVQADKQRTKKEIELGKAEYEVKKKKLDFKHNLIGVLIGVLLFIALEGFCLYMAGIFDAHDNEIKVTASSNSFKGESYESVVDAFEDMGFYYIETAELNDLVTGWITKEGTVDSISINGDKSFSSGEWFPEDAVVRITYHSFSDE